MEPSGQRARCDVLTRSHRLVSGRDFGRAVRNGRRAGTGNLVLHLAAPAGTVDPAPRVGFVVSKSIGNAVTRNLVKRRLRHLVRERLSSLPGGAVLVVRALPAAARASYAELGKDLDAALGRVVRRARAGSPS